MPLAHRLKAMRGVVFDFGAAGGNPKFPRMDTRFSSPFSDHRKVGRGGENGVPEGEQIAVRRGAKRHENADRRKRSCAGKLGFPPA